MNTYERSGGDRMPPISYRVLFIALLFFAVFFFNYFRDIQQHLLSHFDWIMQLRIYADMEHQILSLGQFPHFHTYYFKENNALFANPAVPVLTPVTLLLPLVSLYNFIIIQVIVYYCVALVGIILLRKLFNLPYFSILLMFVLFGFNGRILSNYYVGHGGFITYAWLPLLFYIYLSFMRSLKRTLFYASSVAGVMVIIFFEGGIHLINWILLFFICDAALTAACCALDSGPHPFTRCIISWRFPALTVLLFVGLSAVKLLPVMYIWSGMHFVGGAVGYRDIAFFAQTFYQQGLGSTIPFKEFWLQEAYNYIGVIGSILAAASLIYALFMQRDPLVRRVALVAMIFLIFAVGRNYIILFEHVPILRQERAPGRLVFIALALLSLLIPLCLNGAMDRLRIPFAGRELVLFVLSGAVYWQVFHESRKWMVLGQKPIELGLKLSSRYELPHAYRLCFYSGIAVSVATAIVLVTAALICHRRSRGRTEWMAVTK